MCLAASVGLQRGSSWQSFRRHNNIQSIMTGFHHCPPELASIHLWPSATQDHAGNENLGKYGFLPNQVDIAQTSMLFLCPLCPRTHAILFTCRVPSLCQYPTDFSNDPAPGRKCLRWFAPILSFSLKELKEYFFESSVCSLLLLFYLTRLN